MSSQNITSRVLKNRNGLLLAALSVSAAMLANTRTAHAGQQYLDNNGTTAGYGDAPPSGSINWSNGSTYKFWTPPSDTTGSSTPVGWADGNDAIFSLSTTNTLNMTVAGNVNPNSLQFVTGEVVNFVNNSTNSLITIGTAAGNGGILLYHKGTVTFNNTVVAPSPVIITADSNGGTTLNFGSPTYAAQNNLSGGLILSTPEIRVNFNNTGASGTGTGAGQITVTAPDVIITNANTVISTPSAPAVITIPNALSLNPGGNFSDPITATHPYGFYTSLSSTTFTSSTALGYMNFTGPISGNAGIIIGNGDFTSGGGNNITQFSSSSNTYTGPTVIGMTGGKFNLGAPVYTSYGSLRMGANNALPAVTDVVFGLPNVSKVYGSLDLNGHNLTVNSVSNTTVSNGSVSSNYQPGVEVFAGVANDTPTLSTLTIQSTGAAPSYPLVLDAPIGVTAATLGDSTQAAAGTVTATDAIAVVYNSPATWELGAVSTYTGGTTIENGTIALADTFTSGGGVMAGGLSSTGALTFAYNGTTASGGTLDLAGQNQQVGALNGPVGNGAGTITNSQGSPATFTVNTSTTNSFGGVIADGAGQIAFTKSGTGSLTLAGANTYTGATSILGGTLIVNGSIAAGSAITVAANAVLAGSGKVNGSVLVQSGGIIAPGQLTALNIGGNLTLQPVADLQFKLGGPSNASDSVNLSSGTLALQSGNPVAVEITNAGNLAAGVYHLIDFSAITGGNASNLRLYPLPTGFSGQLVVTGTSVDLDVSTSTPKTFTGAQNGNFNTTDANFSPSNYVDGSPGDAVIFGDNANTSNVTITSPVSPQSITFTNSTLAYTLGGAAITGNSSISLTGGGAVTLTGNNTFSGIILDTFGTLNISADNNLGDPGNAVVLAGSSTPATLSITSSFASNRELILHGAGTVSVATGVTWTENGPVESSGSLIKAGAGTLVLNSASDAYGGSTNVSAGTLLAGVANAIPATTDLSIGTGATFNTSTFSQTISSVAGAGNLVLGSGAVVSTTGSKSSVFTGLISGPGTLTLGGTGSFNVSGANTFGGTGQTVTLASGTLIPATDAALGNAANSLTLNAGSTLSILAVNFSTGRTINLPYSGSASPVPAVNIVLNSNFNASGTSTFSGPISGAGGLSVSGFGFLNLTNASNSFSGGLTINGFSAGGNTSAGVNISTAGALGSGTVTLLNTGILNVTAPVTINNNFQVNVNGGTFNTGANTVTVNGLFAGAQATGVTKLGSGSLILAGAGSLYAGQWNVAQGTLVVNSTNQGITGAGVGGSTGGLLPNNSISPNGTGTFLIANTMLGNFNDNASAPRIYMGKGGSLLGTGVASYGYDGGGLFITKGTSAAPTLVNIGTKAVGDVFTINNEILQYDSTNANSGVTNATITVVGAGKVVLQGGNDNGPTIYAGNWNVSNGILQLGPVIPEANPQGIGGRPYGEPLNALGFVGGDPEQANPVTVSGGILALGVDAPNTNPGFTNKSSGKPANPTPNYLRSPITLQGGALASTGFETSYNTTDMNASQGVPTTVPVSGQFGGNFNVAAGTSFIDTFDPSAPGTPMSVELVGGSRFLSSSGTTNFFTTTWVGTLSINPGNTSGGSFDITRTAGTVNVSSGAAVIVQANSTLNVGTATIAGVSTPVSGTIDPFTATSSVGNSTAKSVALTVAGNLVYATGSGDPITGTTFSLDRLAGLTVQAGGKVTLNAAPSHSSRTLLVTGALSIANNSGAYAGSVNVTNNDLIVQGGSLGTLFTQIQQGYAGGAWNGKGLTSSAAASDTTHLTALGNILNNDGAGHALYGSGASLGLFDGTSPGATDVLVKYTYYGDANLDGMVDASDYSRIDNGFLSHATGWSNGDFNYDGVVDGSDYTLIDNAFNVQGASLAAIIAGPSAIATAQIAGGGASAVPEPATLGLGGIAAMGLLGRRRRR